MGSADIKKRVQKAAPNLPHIDRISKIFGDVDKIGW